MDGPLLLQEVHEAEQEVLLLPDLLQLQLQNLQHHTGDTDDPAGTSRVDDPAGFTVGDRFSPRTSCCVGRSSVAGKEPELILVL